MKRMTRRRAAPALLLATVGCATAGGGGSPPAESQVPPTLQAPGTTPVLRVFARGTQNYRCQQGPSGAPAWTLVAPAAQLFRADDQASGATPIGSHGAGPRWTLDDGSGATGDAARAQKVPSPEAGSIPWLLVPLTPNGAPGALAGVSHVQRLETKGGAAPATGCDAATPGAEVQVPYTATYVFLKPAS